MSWCLSTPMVCQHTMIDRYTPMVCQHTMIDRYTPPTIATHHPQPETVTQQELCNPKTSLEFSKTNEDLNKTLSESAGERKKKFYQFLDSLIEPERTFFLDFCKHAAANAYTNKIALPELWIASHFEELYRQYWAEVNKKIRNSPSVENQAKHSPSAAVMGQCKCSQCSPVEEEEIC